MGIDNLRGLTFPVSNIPEILKRDLTSMVQGLESLGTVLGRRLC
jgi:hypothetical protein